jgi:hypothetical protein
MQKGKSLSNKAKNVIWFVIFVTYNNKRGETEKYLDRGNLI